VLSGRFFRRVVAALAAGSLLVLGALPAEHIHGNSADHSHKIHRHFEVHHSHGAEAEPRSTDHEHDTQWLTAFFTSRETVTASRPATAVVAAVLPALPPHSGREEGLAPADTSTHDPPWFGDVEPRGPPSPTV
jgi:hypothetical protein